MENKFITFNERKIPLYHDYRPMYKVSIILLILHYNGFAGKASLLKLHLFSWSLKSKQNLKVLEDYAMSSNDGKMLFFGIESTLNRALNLAYAEKLVDFENGSYKLRDKGKKFALEIDKDKELFIEEKSALKKIGKKLNENKISNLINEWKNA